MTALSGPAVYRNLLRSIRIAFQNDTRVMKGALDEARHRFATEGRDLARTSKAAQDKLKLADEVSVFLRRNLVQGEKVEGSDEQYRIRITEQTERGDNESIKQAGKGHMGTLNPCGS